MSGMRNWKVGAAVVVGAVFVGAGGAVAAGKLISPGERSQAVVSDAAKQLGVEPAKLTAALKKALENQVDADVAAGRISKEQGEATKKRIEAGNYPLLGVGPRGGFEHGGFHAHVEFGGLDAAATYLGVTEEQLRTELAGGKSLGDVAKAKGKSVDGLVDALVAAANKKIAAAVSAGRLSKAEADRLTASLKEHVTALVNGTVGPRGGPGPGPGFGFGHREHLFGGLDAAASYLGVTAEQLRTELTSGKTLADVAKAKGKSVDGLVTALTADMKKRLANAVAAGRITKADADKALAEIKQRVTDRVNGAGPDGVHGFRHGGPDFGGPPPVGPAFRGPPPAGPPA
jgi:hypothetical protein